MTNTIVVPDGAIAAKMAGVPHIWRIAEILSADPSLKPFLSLRSLYSSIIKLSDYVIVCAHAVMKEFENFLGYKPGNIRVIYSALEISDDMQESRLKIKDENVVFSAGYISPRKDFLTLLRAAKLVHDKIPSVKFRIAGSVSDNNYYKNLLKERKALKLNNVFEFCGFRTDIENLINQSAIFVLSSISEPFGVVLLEAMNAATPMVVTDSGGPSEVVVDGVNGYVVPVKDYKNMADRIIFLLNNKDVAKKMGMAGFERAKSIFNINAFGNNYASLFKNVVKMQRERSVKIHFQIEDIIGLFNDIGAKRKFIRDRIDFYYKVHESFPYKFYKKFLG
jgi:glycosyltransferase involved in cell wall biosynthesis